MKKIQRKPLLLAIGILAVMLLCSSPCRAFLGFGDIVFDPSVFAQTVMTYAKEVQTAINTATQIENQLRSLQNEARNLANMDLGSAAANMAGIQQNLNALVQLQSSVKGLTMDYARWQAEWDKVYKDFASFNGMSGKDYASQAQKILEQTNNATYDAMRAQGLVAQIGNDSANLQGLLSASRSAGGALAAAQAGNQIAGMTAQQLMRLEQIMASSYRAQSSYFAAEAQKQAISNANSKRFFGDRIEKPGSGSGKELSRF